ncbi:MAG: hypothetical protein NUV81_01725 [bacterium]|nr:hypothetical protein [bacterium]
MNYIRVVRSLMSMSRIGDIYDLELRSEGDATRAWGRADGVLRTLLVFPTSYVPAVRLRIRQDGWALQSERHAGGASILCFSNIHKRTSSISVDGLNGIAFAPGNVVVCSVSSHALYDEMYGAMVTTHPHVRMYSGREYRQALYSALLGDAVCVLMLRSEPLAHRSADRVLIESIHPTHTSIRHERRICPKCMPAGSGCVQCEDTGFSERRAVVTV